MQMPHDNLATLQFSEAKQSESESICGMQFQPLYHKWKTFQRHRQSCKP